MRLPPRADLGRGDHVVEWTEPRVPDWMSEAEYAIYPDVMKMRELRYKISVPGYRASDLTVTTTLLDAEAYPAAELATLYGGAGTEKRICVDQV